MEIIRFDRTNADNVTNRGMVRMKKVQKKPARVAKGFILVLVLFTVLILATLIVGLLNLTAIDAIVVKNHLYSLKAYYIAEAGIADAIDKIRQNGPLGNIAWNATFPSGTSNQYAVAVSNSSTVINCAGRVAPSNFTRAIEVELNISGVGPPYDVSIQKWKEKVP